MQNMRIQPDGIGRAADDMSGEAERKRALRKAAIARRKSVPLEDRARAGERLAAVSQSLIAQYGAGNTVAAYVSMGSEIPMQSLLQALLERGVRLLVPMLGSGMDVGWGELASLDDLRAVGGDATPARGGMSDRLASSPRKHTRPDEPVHTRVFSKEALRDADLVILPALMVDHAGTRLGRGGGWYDRALEWLDPAAHTVTVCWPWEVVEGPLPREAHDIPVESALTPDGLLTLR
ncbi:5-formyltetrahydrofolate cyclo-ligase [Bifidobacterium simiiventris]|nr:5-formyltetrahydrofolate cyclo-ligase [Bifidobacterium simiiventris]